MCSRPFTVAVLLFDYPRTTVNRQFFVATLPAASFATTLTVCLPGFSLLLRWTSRSVEEL